MSFDLLKLLDWLWLKVTTLAQSLHAGAAMLGIVVGVAVAEFLAHVLPPSMNAYAADRLTRLVCLGVSMIVTFAMDRTLTGFFLSLMAGLAGPTVHGFALRYVNARWPEYTPKALIACPGDEPRPLLPKDAP